MPRIYPKAKRLCSILKNAPTAATIAEANAHPHPPAAEEAVDVPADRVAEAGAVKIRNPVRRADRSR